jgi:predicted nucleic acid-binding Zn ribbon protein
MNKDNENLINVFENSNSISEVLKTLGITDNSSNWKKIKNLANEIGFNLEIYKNRKKRFCLKCGKELTSNQSKFCSNSCSASYNNIGRKMSNETKNKIRNSLVKKEKNVKLPKKEKIIKHCLNCGCEITGYHRIKFCSPQCSGDYRYKESILKWKNKEIKGYTSNYSLKDFVRKYILIKNENKCEKCECNLINPFSNKSILQIHHIDNDVSNDNENNLQALCPNCHALTGSFMGLNKGNSKRVNRYK